MGKEVSRNVLVQDLTVLTILYLERVSPAEYLSTAHLLRVKHGETHRAHSTVFAGRGT